MNKVKKVLALILTAALMVPSMGVAAGSVTPTNITAAIGTSATATTTYTGSDQILKFTIGGKELVEGVHFVVDGTEPINVGTYKINIKGTGLYEGSATITYTINKAPKPVYTISTKTVTAVKKGFTAKSLKKKAKTIKLGVKTTGKVTYTVKVKKALKKYITVSKKGKVTLKKGAKKGTYKIVIKIKGTKNFKAGKKTIKIKVK